MIRYFEASKLDLEKGSSFAIRLSQPQVVAESNNNVTKFWYTILQHPDKSNKYIAIIKDEESLPIADKNSIDLLNPLNQYLVEFFPQSAERLEKQAQLANKKQTKITTLIPKRWKEKTYEELSKDGWFPSAAV